MNTKNKEYFSANKAREICDEINNRPPWIVELENILSIIEVSAKEGKDNIRSAADQTKDHHNENGVSHTPQEGQDLSNSEKFQMGGFLFCFHASTSAPALWVS